MMMSCSKNKTITYSVLLLLCLGLFTVACKNNKNDDDGAQPEKTGYANDQLLLEHFNSNTDRIVEKAFLLGASSIGSCVSIKKIESENGGAAADTMLIAFGNSGCLGYDGKTRTGVLTVVYDKNKGFRDIGSYIKILYNNYRLNGHQLKGYKDITNVGTDAQGNIQFSVRRVDTVILPDNEGVITGNSERTRVWYKGSGTIHLSDDVYRTTGTGTFIRANGDEYSIEIKEALFTPLNCNWITNGTINIYPTDATHRVLDYGAGDCENDATIDVNGVITNIQAPL